MRRIPLFLAMLLFIVLGLVRPSWAAGGGASKQIDRHKPSDQAVIEAFEDYRDHASDRSAPAKLASFRSLLVAGGNPNLVRSGSTLLYDARTADMARVLIEAGADVKARDESGRTVLMGDNATNLAILKVLVAAGADRDATTKSGDSPVHHVCDRSVVDWGAPDKDAAERIALIRPKTRSLDAYAPSPFAMHGTPLFKAASQHNPDCVRALIASGASLDAPGYSERVGDTSPSGKGMSVRQRVLKEKNEYPDYYDEETVRIFQTVGLRDGESVKEDVDAEVIRAFGKYYFKPTSENLEVFAGLIKAGGNPNAVYHDYPLLFDVPDAKMAKALIAMGANVKHKDEDRNTVLLGSNAGKLDVVRVLLSAGAEIDVPNAVGMIPLHFVCGLNYDEKPDPEAKERIALLTPKGRSLDQHYGKRGQHTRGTPLMFAAMSDNPECFKALIAAGARPDAQAYSDGDIEAEPELRGSVREQVAKDVKKHPRLYSAEIVKTLDIR